MDVPSLDRENGRKASGRRDIDSTLDPSPSFAVGSMDTKSAFFPLRLVNDRGIGPLEWFSKRRSNDGIHLK